MKISLQLVKNFIDSDNLIEEHEIIALITYHAVMKELGYTFRLEECYPHVCIIYYVGFYEIKATFLYEKAQLILEKV